MVAIIMAVVPALVVAVLSIGLPIVWKNKSKGNGRSSSLVGKLPFEMQGSELSPEQQARHYKKTLSTVPTDQEEQKQWEALQVQYPPQVLNLTFEEMKSFHPVVIFPMVDQQPYYHVWDLQNVSLDDNNNNNNNNNNNSDNQEEEDPLFVYGVGKYNEIRAQLYATDLFQDRSHDIDGYSGQRIVHIGIDLGGPVGTPIYSFADNGRLVHAGYNDAEGDYGHVIVIAHDGLGYYQNQTLFVLYGHLSAATLDLYRDQAKDQIIRRGQILGWMGNTSENGGWPSIHVHMQMSLLPPQTHDMPGVVSMADRPKALYDYPDPRLVLGMLYY